MRSPTSGTLLVANDDGSVKRTVPETAEVIFALNGWRNRGEATELSRDRIDVSAGTITWLCEGFARQWHRGPDAHELRGLALAGAEF